MNLISKKMCATAVIAILIVIVFGLLYLSFQNTFFAQVENIKEFLVQNIAVIGIIISIIISLLIPLIGFTYNRNRKVKAYFEVIWKKSSSLKPTEVLGLRGEAKYGFNKYYYSRELDKTIVRKIEANEHVLVAGNPLAGKSRAIYQALCALEKPCNVIIPKVIDVMPPDLKIPLPICFWRKKILLLDDLDKFVEKQNFTYLLRIFLKRDCVVVATCRSGPEYDRVCDKIEAYSIFGDPVIIPRISPANGKEVARNIGKVLPSSFDGNIGSIFLQLNTMKERFKNCSSEERSILRSIKRLYRAGIYKKRRSVNIEKIKKVCERKEEMAKKRYEWTQLLEELDNKAFVKIANSEVFAEEAYLESIVKDDFSALDNLKDMMDIFCNDPEALSCLGRKALGLEWQSRKTKGSDAQCAEYLKFAIKAFEEALKVYTFERFPVNYAEMQYRLGEAYASLASQKIIEENCTENFNKAIRACEEALKIYSFERFSDNYMATQRCLFEAYHGLASRLLIELVYRSLNASPEHIEYIMEHLEGYLNKTHELHQAIKESITQVDATKADIEAKTESRYARLIELVERARKEGPSERMKQELEEDLKAWKVWRAQVNDMVDKRIADVTANMEARMAYWKKIVEWARKELEEHNTN